MIKNRYFNWLAVILMGIAVTGVVAVLVLTQVRGFIAAAVHFDYEATLFGDQVTEIDLQVDESDWENLLGNAVDKEYIPAQVTINGKTVSEVGLRAKGNTSLTQVASNDTTDRYSFKLEFDHYISDQTFDGLDKLALNNVISDPTYMKEYLSYQMLETIGVKVPKYGFANVTVNGKPWGLYFSVEALEESFLQRNYGTDYGKLYKPETDEGGGRAMGGERPQMPDGMRQRGFPAQENQPEQAGQPGRQERPEGAGFGSTSGGSSLVYTDSSADSYTDIFDNAVTKISSADEQRVIEALEHLASGEDLDRYFDTDEILRYFAANTAMVNLDSYVGMFTHNYYLYEKDGQLSVLPWDYNLSFGGFQQGSASDVVNFPIDTPTASGISLTDRPLIGKLLENEEYQKKYHKYLQEIVDKYFESGLFELTIEKIDRMIGEYVKNDATAFYTYEEYQAAVRELKTLGSLRAQSIQGQLSGSIPSTRDGQQENPDALLDASEVNLSALGDMGWGRQGDRDQRGQGNQQEPAFGRPPEAQQAGNFGKGFPFAREDSPNNTITPQTWWMIGLSGAAMLLGLLFVIVYRRRRPT